MDCSYLRAYLESELPPAYEHETLANCILDYFSHKGMEMTKEDEQTIRDLGEDPEDYFNFDENQLAQFEAIYEAAQNLIDVLCDVPEHLKQTFVQDGTKPHSYLIAERVADILKQDVSYVFFPVRVENGDGTKYITDLHE